MKTNDIIGAKREQRERLHGAFSHVVKKLQQLRDPYVAFCNYMWHVLFAHTYEPACRRGLDRVGLYVVCIFVSLAVWPCAYPVSLGVLAQVNRK